MVKECIDYQEDLSALLDSELGDQDKAEVTKHLTDCCECASRFETINSLSSFIGHEALNLQTQDLWEKIQADLPSVCEVIEEDLSAYLDGELPPAAQEGVNAHLKDCRSCLEKFKLLNATNQLLAKGLELPETIEVDVWSAIKSRISADCDVVGDELSAYVDQEVEVARHRFITTHLIGCMGCRDDFEKITQMGDVIKEHYKPHIPENLNLWPGIKSKMPQVVPFTPRQTQGNKKNIVQPRFAVMATAAAAVIALLGSLTLWLSLPEEANLPRISPESYLIESSFQEPTDTAEAVVYE